MKPVRHISEVLADVIQTLEVHVHAKGIPDIFEETAWQDRHRAFKQYYGFVWSDLQNQNSTDHRQFFSPHIYDWSKLLTPIELLAWDAIRFKGNIVLYPQFPVGPYLLDFGNPFKKIGLELDGKDFHDPVKDRFRDGVLLKSGWTIYRIPGAQMCKSKFVDWDGYCLNPRLDYDKDHPAESSLWGQVSSWLTTTGDGVIESIGHIHFGKALPVPERRRNDATELCILSLMRHKFIW